jgi:hypothetical protein
MESAQFLTAVMSLYPLTLWCRLFMKCNVNDNSNDSHSSTSSNKFEYVGISF